MTSKFDDYLEELASTSVSSNDFIRCSHNELTLLDHVMSVDARLLPIEQTIEDYNKWHDERMRVWKLLDAYVELPVNTPDDVVMQDLDKDRFDLVITESFVKIMLYVVPISFKWGSGKVNTAYNLKLKLFQWLNRTYTVPPIEIQDVEVKDASSTNSDQAIL